MKWEKLNYLVQQFPIDIFPFQDFDFNESTFS